MPSEDQEKLRTRDIPFVDAHVHLWDLDRISYPWLTPPFDDESVSGSTAAIAKTYLLDDYLADAAGWNVVGVVHVDAGATPEAALDETSWLQGIATACGLPNGIVAFAALDDPQLETLLERQVSHRNVRGIRHILNWHSDPRKSYTPTDLLCSDAWARGYGTLARHGLSFDLQVYPAQLTAAAGIARHHPDVPIILNHAGMPINGAEGRDEWRDGMRALADLPHASVKISGFGIIDHGWSAHSIRNYVLDTIELFGSLRTMFASDFPTDKLYADFDAVLGAYDSIVAEFSHDERRDLFGRNANRIYRLGLDL